MASGMSERPTGDIVVKDIIFLDDIVDNLLGVFVDNQAFPLQRRQLTAGL